MVEKRSTTFGALSDLLGRLDLVRGLVLRRVREGAAFADAAHVCVEALHTEQLDTILRSASSFQVVANLLETSKCSFVVWFCARYHLDVFNFEPLSWIVLRFLVAGSSPPEEHHAQA